MPPVDPPSAESPSHPDSDADRLVFFISGFDPKGPGYYHRLFSDEARLATERGRARIETSARRNQGPWISTWRVRWRSPAPSESPAIHTDYRFLRWDDIVRRHWTLTLWQLVCEYVRLYADVFRLGVFRRLRAIGRGPAFMTLMPLGTALGLLAGSFVLLLAASAPAIGVAFALPLAAVGAVIAWRLAERSLETEWLLRLYGFTRDQAQGRLPELEQRLDDFAREIAGAAAQTRARELLVVGYSNGSIMAASVVARVLALCPSLGRGAPALSFLTLGHCTPVLASFPSAGRFRTELRALANEPSLTWVDYSAPADLAAFAGVAPWMGKARGCKLRQSPRFHAAMSQEAYRRLRSDRRALHLHYLRAPVEQAGADAYDYFALVGGPLTLQQRCEAAQPPCAADEARR